MKEDTLLQCPCCDFFTLERRADFDICPVCGWEDDGLNPEKPDDLTDPATAGGPNGMTLLQGRREFVDLVAKEGAPVVATQYKYQRRII